MTDPCDRSPARRTAIWTASTRDICPAPTPTAAPSLKSTMAFDFTCLTAVQAKPELLPLRFGRCAPRSRRAGGAVEPRPVPLLDEKSSRHSPHVEVEHAARGRLGSEHDHRLAPRQHVFCLGQHLGRDDDVGDDLNDALRGRPVERAVDRNDAAERRHRVALVSHDVRLGGVSATARPHGFMCLTIATAARS